MKSTENKASIWFLYFIQLLFLEKTKIHIVIHKITLSIDIVEYMICIYVRNNVL